MTAWTEHVKAFAKEHNISYPCAISMPACSASYKGKAQQPKKPKVAQPKVYSAEDETAIREMIEDARQALEEAEADAETDPVGFRAFKKKMEQVIETGLKSLAKPYSPKPKKVYLLKAPKVKKPKKAKAKPKTKAQEMYRLTGREYGISDIMKPELEELIRQNVQYAEKFSKQAWTEDQIKEAKNTMDLFTDFHLKLKDPTEQNLFKALKGFVAVDTDMDGPVTIMVWDMISKYWRKLGLYTSKTLYSPDFRGMPTNEQSMAWTGRDPEKEHNERVKEAAKQKRRLEKEEKQAEKKAEKQAKKNMLAEEKRIKKEAKLREKEEKLREKEDKMPVYTGREKELRQLPTHQLEDMIMSYQIKSGTSKDAMVAAILTHEAKKPKAGPKFTPLEEAIPIQKPATAAEIKAFREKMYKQQKVSQAKEKEESYSYKRKDNAK